MKFKVGDKVKIKGGKENKNWNNIMDKWVGKTMTIRVIRCEKYRMIEDENEHYGAGWYWIEEWLEPVNNQSIHITTDGKTTYAVLKYGKEVIKRAKAECFASDEFNFEFGAKLALERLYSEQPLQVTMEEVNEKFGRAVEIVEEVKQ